ncbi:MAG: sigma factor-like helix-turn-helix DNA-binding protein [Candidatus Thorarchaeota archaeon]
MERRRFSRSERIKETEEVELDKSEIDRLVTETIRDFDTIKKFEREIEKLESRDIHRMYFEEGMTHSEIADKLGYKSTKPIQRIFREEGWEARAGKATDIENDVHRLYFDEGLSQREVAEQLELKSVKAVRRVFEEQGWETRPKRNLKLENQVKNLYFDEELTQSEVAEELGMSRKWVQDVFKRNEWEARSRKIEGIEDDVFQMYFEEKLTQEEVAKELNLSKDTILRVFQEMDWESREPRRGVTMRTFETEEERTEARREHRRATYEKIKELRENLFGSECKLCIDSESRKTFIHRKDGAEHDDINLWSLRDLREINPDEWQRLCTACHRGSHWTMDELGMEWNEIESLRKSSLEGNQTSEGTITLDENRMNFDNEHLSVEDMRRNLFGTECSVCSQTESEKGLIIHNKAGLPHDRHFLWTKENLNSIDSEEWVALCRKCHRHTHWSMKELGFSWESIESRLGE